ncbi:BON domain-containing protein [Azospirillum doebereinerae]|uniref:BON domain-containing protein n=1 Tax=Azospirillum doebereinerae TaxID=92933 RepID=A0A3S0XE10_9PROT|nr:BON domain-containing protein [Azospirillum doebereinerae]RUQ75626.1 BON domain-containing protein [Azospirillum doebereinerae]
MAQNEYRGRNETRDWGHDWRNEDWRNDDHRWRGEGRRFGGDDRDDYRAGDYHSGDRGGVERGGPEWQGGREVYRGQPGSESGRYGRDAYGHDTARESERSYGRTFGGGRDESRSDFGGYGGGYGGRSGSSGYGGYSGGGSGGTGRDERGYRDAGADYSRGYGAGYGERDLGRNPQPYSRDYSGDVAGRSYGPYTSPERNYGVQEGRDRYDPRRGRVEERGFWEQAGDEVASWFGDDDAQRRRHQDEQRASQNRGRGPRGYSRSDDRVREDINDRLTDDAYIDASEIDVAVSKGEVTLSGTVTHRSAKRRAEDIAEAISGVTHVQNNLRVRQDAGGFGASSTGAGASAMAGAGGTNPTNTLAGANTLGGTTGGAAASTAGTGSSVGTTTGTVRRS